jgi:hypothetical protein
MAILILLIACMALLIGSGLMQERAVYKWTRMTGRAPRTQRGRGSWGAYMRANKYDMPHSLLKEIAVWRWIGISALLLLMFAIYRIGAHPH